MTADLQPERSRGCLGRMVRVMIGFLAIIAAVLLGLFINQILALRRFPDRYPPPGEIVDVDGHRMHIHCAGSGSFSVEWLALQERLQATTRFCVYDRAGYGWSEAGPEPRDGAQVVSELYRLLEAAGEQGPFVLVGHSLGGVHAQLYAGRYPDQVAGLVDAPAEYVISPDFEEMTQSSVSTYRTVRLLAGSGLLRALAPPGRRGCHAGAGHKDARGGPGDLPAENTRPAALYNRHGRD